ncbi:MAG: zinc-binding dehydrogenase [Candidatus Eisenbacteria bacterium]|uniref:Zinc-binding dehydrogenase n=1 Tax=Eiseniibacteriota bacterium TaxID=2212470 RepID=A0A948RZL4_UNCEI|nr:zinc-binding dehydrogenase [Candidatus Eisenbacteria bacterium]MBU1951156.1 zinc-binding dehydrogenase [Candidatus Eisenbacteria bacterium]MBU2692504.1 zinc-binding dehydrogenase [Candidatus Eisenbacteria bacterium]
MKAWRVFEHGGPEVLRFEESARIPEPGPGEARVKVLATALNHLDLWVRRGVPGHTFPLPLTPGCDVSGLVDQLGAGVQGWGAGDPVLIAPGIGCGRCPRCLEGRDNLCRRFGILGESRDGGCADMVVVPASHLIPHPDNLSPEEGAAVPLVLQTAWHMLVNRAALQAGEWVLVQAGASGVGSMAIQIAKLWGAQVIATVATPSKADRVRELGAVEVIVSTEQNVRKEIRRITGGGVDIVLDHLGGVGFIESLSCLNLGGRLVNCGATIDPKIELDLRHLFFKNLQILGSTMGTRGEIERGIDLVRKGFLHPVVDRVFPMEELPEAHRYLEERRAVGKVVLKGFKI